MNYLVTIPDLRGGQSVHLYRDEPPMWMGRKDTIPGAKIVAEIPDWELGKSLEELMAIARMKAEYA